MLTKLTVLRCFIDEKHWLLNIWILTTVFKSRAITCEQAKFCLRQFRWFLRETFGIRQTLHPTPPHPTPTIPACRSNRYEWNILECATNYSLQYFKSKTNTNKTYQSESSLYRQRLLYVQHRKHTDLFHRHSLR